MRVADFHYDLPPDRIAQRPTPRRDQSRLLALDRRTRRWEHRLFPDLASQLRAGDLLVLNDSRVIPARLHGRKAGSGGEIEILLADECGPNDWWVMLRPGKRVRPGTIIEFSNPDGSDAALAAIVREKSPDGLCRLGFTGAPDLLEEVERLGDVPLPPYIERPEGRSEPEDRERYQTVFARSRGSVAAPTAGLHFTPGFLDQLQAQGVLLARLTLHVGPGTFAPVKVEDVANHRMHEERFSVGADLVAAVAAAKRDGRRIVAVGTTTLRVLEHLAARSNLPWTPGAGRTRIFIHPPYAFRIANALVTNFHLPESTLLMLVCAFADPGGMGGREFMLAAYAEAVRERYRFFSYGDAMWIA